MIARLFNPSTARAAFSACDLPNAVQGSILQRVLVPRVVSRSMTPTIQKGDELKIGPADSIQAGDVIVYRQDRLFICHRVERIEGPHLYVRGDANRGPSERVGTHQVVGRVTALLRDGERLAVPPCSSRDHRPASLSVMPRFAAWIQAKGRAFGLLVIKSTVALPPVGTVMRRILDPVVTIDILEQAPLQSLLGCTKPRHFQLNQIDRLAEHLSGLKSDLSRITLVIRVGPLYLGACRLHPWDHHIRPFATALGLQRVPQSIRSHLRIRTPR